jgi:thioredoxin 1
MKTILFTLLTAGLLVGPVTTVTAQTNAPASVTNAAAVKPAKAPLPKLLDLGANKCVPCKMMTPVLEELKKEYAGQLEVEFIDVWKDKDAGKPYHVEMIPTQIFFDANGKELFRHTGFMPKAEVLSKWKELGLEFKPAKK